MATLEHQRPGIKERPPRLIPEYFAVLPGFADQELWPRTRRVEEGRLAGTYRQPTVSLPRSSNRTCPVRASGFPTDFTISARKRSPRKDAVHQVSRTQLRPSTWQCLAKALCGDASETLLRTHRRSD